MLPMWNSYFLKKARSSKPLKLTMILSTIMAISIIFINRIEIIFSVKIEILSLAFVKQALLNIDLNVYLHKNLRNAIFTFSNYIPISLVRFHITLPYTLFIF
jgi:hypothetical protein